MSGYYEGIDAILWANDKIRIVDAYCSYGKSIDMQACWEDGTWHRMSDDLEEELIESGDYHSSFCDAVSELSAKVDSAARAEHDRITVRLARRAKAHERLARMILSQLHPFISSQHIHYVEMAHAHEFAAKAIYASIKKL
jgi:hypothetical protein